MYNFIKSGSIILLLFLLATALFLTFPSCDDNPTDNENIKSPREYTWTADTVYNPDNFQTLMSSIWGSSENDIYMCGHASKSPGNLWHYDGTKWLAIDLWDKIGESANLTSVHGTSWKNVWVVGYQTRGIDDSKIPYIINYDGLYWKRYEIDVDMAPYSVYVVDKNDVWICGTDGIVGHFNGSVWDVDTIQVDINENEVFQLTSIISINSIVYIRGIKSINNGVVFIYYFFKKENGSVELVAEFNTDSQNQNFLFGSSLYKTQNNELFSHGHGGVFKWQNNKWENIFYSEESQTAMGSYGSNNILIGDALYGNLHHFNGANWEKLQIMENSGIWWTGIWMNKGKAIVIGKILNETPQKTIVLRGE